MKALAAFIMQGRWQPVLFMTASTLLPLLAWLGGAALALVTLRRGASEGLVALVGSAALLGLVFGSMGANPLVSVAGLLEYWVPVFLLALVLRQTISLPVTIMAGGALGLVGLTIWYLLVPDPVAFWEQSLGPLVEGEETAELFQGLLPVMSGFWVLGLWGIAMASLLLGRWWQAVLYNPGGFREEFHGLRLDWRLAMVTLVIMLAATWTGPGLVYDLSLLLSGMFALQALAVTHAWRAAKQVHWMVMVPVYGLMPFLFKLYALLGIADTWFDFRKRRASHGDDG